MERRMVVVGLLLAGCVATPQQRVPEAVNAVPGEFLVRVLPGADDVLAGHDARPVFDGLLADHPAMADTWRVRTDRTTAERIARHPEVGWVVPHGRVAPSAVPNDPLWGSAQWHLPRVGVERAWRSFRGEGMLVGVVDTGIDPGEDGFGCFRADLSWDFIDGDDDIEDIWGHGTHVAGTINQRSDNMFGGAGIAPGASVFSAKVIDDEGWGTDEEVAAGILFAADQGAHVINLSLTGPDAEPIVEEAVAYANSLGAVVVAAAGNGSRDDGIDYPAAIPGVIAVAATDLLDERTWYSNAGDDVDLTAPGGDTTVDLDEDGWPDGVVQEAFGEFVAYQGTSMSTPHVAAAAALVMQGGVTDPEEVREKLTSSAVDLGPPGFDPEYGHGMLDVGAAIALGVDEEVALEVRDVRVNPVAPGAARVHWTSSRRARGIAEQEDGTVLGGGAGRRFQVEILGEPGDEIPLDLVIDDGYTVATEPVLVEL